MTVGRILLRILVVPLGALVAVTVSILVLVFTHWQIFARAMTAPGDSEDQTIAAFTLVPIVLFMLVTSGVYLLLPAVIGVALAEAFAIRSFLFHAANGSISAWIGWAMSARFDEAYPVYGDPKFIVAAGLAAGIAYWLVAGWNAGLRPPTPAVA